MTYWLLDVLVAQLTNCLQEVKNRKNRKMRRSRKKKTDPSTATAAQIRTLSRRMIWGGERTRIRNIQLLEHTKLFA